MEEVSPYILDDLEVIPKKYRCFTFVAYSDSSSYDFDTILFNLKSYKYWAYIKHMPEVDEKKRTLSFYNKIRVY